MSYFRFTSLGYAKYSLIWVFSRSFLVPFAPFSMLGGPGGTVIVQYKDGQNINIEYENSQGI